MFDSLTAGLNEDCPYGDITTELLGISGLGKFRFISREDAIISGTPRLKEFFESKKLQVVDCKEAGTPVAKGGVIIEAHGELTTLFKLWRICQTYLTVMSAIATQTHKLVSAAREVNPDIQIVVACRKAHLGMRLDEMRAIQDGGAIYHRNSLSDTILITQNHMRMLDSLPEKLYSMQHKIEFEPSNLEEAFRYASCVDVMLLDHFEAETLKPVVQELRQMNPKLQIGVAGGITLDTVKKFAGFVDLMVLSSVLYAYPLDFTCRIERI
ncbi:MULTISPECIES: quinolinate phosphoribosyl transferase [Sporomusa]|uniref:quinolinate phosphoribosyl transferase n=1 Tax=Sporomusa TaxID=2375 RepID=UPI001663048E|nr:MULTISPECIES: quinolinate phosphoribosyl transferase [Sporomusa]MCM0759165.1 quinolinate phosphoribosyl transferase [Sporomusa sphaeroides DSM 2875]